MESKRWRQLVPRGTWHHLAIILFLPNRVARLHRHDFPEIFWVEQGQGVHHVNGQLKRLDPGDLVFIRPEDEHRLEATSPGGFTLLNLAYAPQVRRDLLRRYRPELAPLLAPSGPLPFRAKLDPASCGTLRALANRLGHTKPSRLLLEHFLLGLYPLTQPSAQAAVPSMPDWLRHACEQLQRPEIFAQGTPGFAKVASRSAEHVARTLQAILGLTPSELVNQVRMEFAARELRVTGRPIAEIALDCGLNNLSHFYALFRKAHRQTPRAYRLAHHRAVA